MKYLLTESALILFLSSSLFAQTPGGPPQSGGFNPMLAKLFGSTGAFTAKATTQIQDQRQKETMSMTMGFALLDGDKAKTEIDLTQVKSPDRPTGSMQQLKQMGMDRMVTIMRWDKKVLYLIYPGLKAYVEMPIPDSEAKQAAEELKIEKTELGKERIDGHPCVKTKVKMTDSSGIQFEAISWNATDLKDFPIQTRFTQNENTITTRYRDIEFTKPDAKQFEPPAEYARHTNLQQLMQAAVQKMLGGLGGKN